MSAKEQNSKLQTLIPVSLQKRVRVAAALKEVPVKDFVAAALEVACDAVQVPATAKRRPKAA